MEEGDRVAQLIIEKIYTPDVMEVDVCIIFSCLIHYLKLYRISKKLCEEQAASALRVVINLCKYRLKQITYLIPLPVAFNNVQVIFRLCSVFHQVSANHLRNRDHNLFFVPIPLGDSVQILSLTVKRRRLLFSTL